MTRRVCIVQRRLTHYRVPLFERLRAELDALDIELSLLVGKATPAEESRRDSGEIHWARTVPTHYIAGSRLCWQPINRYLSGIELLVVTQENSLLANHGLLLLPRKFSFAFWGHGANLQRDGPGALKERFKRWTNRYADWWFAYTQMSAALVEQTGFPPDRITTLNNAIDTSELRRQMDSVTDEEKAALRQELRLGNGPVAAFVGSFHPDKRLDLLFLAADALREFYPEFRLLVIGDGPKRDAVENYSACRPWCSFVGTKTGREKAVHLAVADVMLNPGLVGLGLLDAFASGVPLVTTDCRLHSPEIAYLKHNENGVITENSLNAFVTGVRQVLEDDAQRARIAEGGRVAAGLYTIENMARNFANGIERALPAGAALQRSKGFS